MDAGLTWSRLIDLLEEHHPPRSPVSRDPFHLILFEQVAYLATEDVRIATYRDLKKRTGLKPDRILAMPLKELETVTRAGGSIAWKERAQRIRASSAMASTLKGLDAVPLAEARKRLRKFAMIGAPGADRILLQCGLFPVFALESNGLRVMLRLGAAREGRDYAATYRSVMKAMTSFLPADIDTLALGEQLLRSHGIGICTRNAPRCGTCSLLPYCPTGRERSTSKGAWRS